MQTFQLNAAQSEQARRVAVNCLAFEEERKYPLGTAIVRHHWNDGSSEDVLAALEAYQNNDGGFGNGLEVDIQASVSNPFAARLAMQILLSLRQPPKDPLVDRLGTWLNTTQAEDGDWHFAPEIYEAPLAPWFQGWTFPNINPACCITGLGNALGLLTPETVERTARLFGTQGSIDQARSGEFYEVLPYVEYFRSIDHPDRARYLDALAANTAETANNGTYADAGHFFDHALAAGPDLVRRLPPDLLSAQADRLLEEPAEDGGWPNPYSEAWRPLASAMATIALAHMRDGV
jgi:hypothetical protein